MAAQKNDFIIGEDETQAALTVGGGRATTTFPMGRLSLNFIGGLCSGRSGVLLAQPKVAIGRDEECDIVLEGETVSRRHCVISRWGMSYVLQDGSRNGTFLNGERVSQAKLNDGDQIRVGQNVLLVTFSSGAVTNLFAGRATTPQSVPPNIELQPNIVVKGLEEGVTQSFSEERITMGRRAENQVVLEADNISRNHAAIERQGGAYFVRDLGSANGTFVNGIRTEFVQLNDSDRVRVGSFAITIYLLEEDCILNFRKMTK